MRFRRVYHHVAVLVGELKTCLLYTSAILISIELILNATDINFAVFNRFLFPGGLEGYCFSLFSIAISAAETAVAIAIMINIYRNIRSCLLYTSHFHVYLRHQLHLAIIVRKPEIQEVHQQCRAEILFRFSCALHCRHSHRTLLYLPYFKQ